MANTAWSATDKSANITLSNVNLTATAAGGLAGVRAADKQITGKFYWEATLTNWSTTDCIGVASPNWVLTAALNSGTNIGTCCLNGAGSVAVDGVNVGGIAFGTITSGTVVCIAIDVDARLIWFRLGAAGNWNTVAANNPATGVGGVAIISLGIGIPVYPALSMTATPHAVTANFGGSAFTGAVPAGFTSGFTSGVTSPTNAIATQSVLEQFFVTSPPAQVTQVSIEQWASTGTITGQVLVTQIALEQWASAAAPQTINLVGNLGGASHYGKLSYGLKHYSRISAFAPVFSGDLDNSLRNVSGGFAPVVFFDADLQVARLDLFSGDLAPQIALGGSLSLDLPLNVLEGGLTPIVVLGASSFVSGPLWADTDPCPAPPWAPSDLCPPPPWMISAPCDPVVWSKSRMCNG